MAMHDTLARPDGQTPTVRFEATLAAASHAQALAVAEDLALDRLPDVKRRVRLLITADDARRLLERGFEVHLFAAIPVAPLPRALIMTDAQAKTWLEGELKGIARKGGQ